MYVSMVKNSLEKGSYERNFMAITLFYLVINYTKSFQINISDISYNSIKENQDNDC